MIRCIYCGKFISYAELEAGKAKTDYTPLSEFTKELIEHYHVECKDTA